MQESASAGDKRAVTVLGDAATESVPGAARDRGAPNGLGVRALPPGDPRWLEVGEQYADILSQVQHASDVITVTDTLLARISDAEVRARLQARPRRSSAESTPPCPMGPDGEVSAALQIRLSGYRALASTRTGTAETASRAAQSVLAGVRRLGDRPAEQVVLQVLARTRAGRSWAGSKRPGRCYGSWYPSG